MEELVFLVKLQVYSLQLYWKMSSLQVFFNVFNCNYQGCHQPEKPGKVRELKICLKG